MLGSLLLSWLLLAGPKNALNTTPAPPAAVVPIHRVRAITDITKGVLSDATLRSPTVRQLIAELDQTDVIVYVESQFDLQRAQGRTTFITANEAGRFLRIVIDAMLDPWRRQEILGHELQHALEIAHDRTVRDESSMKRLFRSIGWQTGEESYETGAALDTEKRVHRELSVKITRPNG